MAKRKSSKPAAAARKRTAKRASAARKKTTSRTAPARKKAAAKRAAPARKKAAAKRAAPARKKAAAKRAAPARKKATAKRAAPARKKVAARRAAPARNKRTAEAAPSKQRKSTARSGAKQVVQVSQPPQPAMPSAVELAAMLEVETTSAGIQPLAPEHAPVDDLTSSGNEMLDIFHRYDRNRTGYIEREEFARLQEALGNEDMSDEELQIAFDIVDTDRTGKISWKQFKNWWMSR